MTKDKTASNTAPMSIDLGRPGKQFGHIRIPHSRDEAGWGELLIPIVSIKGTEGPAILVAGGNHGDEWEGQVVLRRLAHEIDVNDVTGQIILIPTMNLPAACNNSRTSPIDGKNMNRIFPGDPVGTITEKICSAIYHNVVLRADVVLDLHAGGRTLHTLPYTMMHRYETKERSRETLDISLAFAVPISVVFDTEPDREGMLDTVVEDLDKPFVAVELGGSGSLSPASVEVTHRGVKNVLRHCGHLPGEVERVGKTEVMGVPANGFVVASDHGIFEPFVENADRVSAGQAIGQIHSMHRPDREPIVHFCPAAGTVITRRSTGLTEHGDCLVAVGEHMDPGF